MGPAVYTSRCRRAVRVCACAAHSQDPGGNNLGIRLPLRGRCGVAFLGKGWAIDRETRPASNRDTLGADAIISAWVLTA